MEILLDCDGVLADFVTASIEAHGRSDTHDQIDSWDYFRDGWGMSPVEFWTALRGRDFWTDIRPYPWIAEFHKKLQELGTVTILTSPCDDTECASGKAIWLDKHLGIRPSATMIGSRKELLAKSKHLLIDDSESNVNKFRDAGGHAILFPQPWNSGLGDWRTVLETTTELHRILG